MQPTSLTISLEDRPGQLAAVGEALGNAGVNITGGCAVTGGGQGDVHILVDDPDAARAALNGAGIAVSTDREVVVVPAEDKPGTLGATARKLADAGVNIEVFYVSNGPHLVFGVDDVNKAKGAL